MDGIPYTDHSIMLLCCSTIFPMAKSDLCSSLSFDYWVLNLHNNFWGSYIFRQLIILIHLENYKSKTQCPERSKAPFAGGQVGRWADQTTADQSPQGNL